MARESAFSTFGAEPARRGAALADELPELAEVSLAARGSDQPAVGTKDPAQLAERLLEVLDVVEHPRRNSAIEDPVVKRQILRIGDNRFHSTRSRQLDHALRLVDGHDARLQLA